MKNLSSFMGKLAMMLLGLCIFAACSDDDGPSYSNAVLQNTELKTILTQKGYTFNEQGNLLLDDLANNTTSLDLSNTNISQDALAELSILPNLTDVNLSNNGYGDTFDFAKLPAQITGVDLTGNKIYNYDNLVKVTIAENGDETIENLHNITKLYLPNEAKDNIAQLVRFYCQNKSAIENGTMDVKMSNASGTLEKYNTLREIPDETLRNYLKEIFPSMFSDNQIDVSRHFSLTEKRAAITIYKISKNIEDLEGVQYIINHPEWTGASCNLNLQTNNLADKELPYLMPNESLGSLALSKITCTKGIDLSRSQNIKQIQIANVKGLKKIDISVSKIFGQRDADSESSLSSGSVFKAENCEDLKEVVFPNVDNLKVAYLFMAKLPALEKLDMNNFSMIGTLSIGDLSDNYQLSYPNLTVFHNEFGEEYTNFSCTRNTYNLPVTKSFIEKYYKSSPQRIQCGYDLGDYDEVYWEFE